MGLAAEKHHRSSRELTVTAAKLWPNCGHGEASNRMVEHRTVISKPSEHAPLGSGDCHEVPGSIARWCCQIISELGYPVKLADSQVSRRGPPTIWCSADNRNTSIVSQPLNFIQADTPVQQQRGVARVHFKVHETVDTVAP